MTDITSYAFLVQLVSDWYEHKVYIDGKYIGTSPSKYADDVKVEVAEAFGRLLQRELGWEEVAE